jgi:deoxyadenosine/deoxycytidine kinase
MNAPLSNKTITLDGNIGVGKSTLLERVRAQCPEVLVVQEPVTMWTSLQNEQGTSLLELFYGDKRRWSYTFQNAAILSRIKCLKEALAVAKPGQLILTERSVLTDRYVFAAMLREQGCLDALEGSLYDMWFEAFANDFPVTAIVYLTTGPAVAAERIKRRARGGEAEIDPAYLSALDRQHKAWISSTSLPVLELSTDEGTDLDKTVDALRCFFKTLA